MIKTLEFKGILTRRYLLNSIYRILERINVQRSWSKRCLMAGKNGVRHGSGMGLSSTVDNPEVVLFKFGVISDVQFGNVDNRLNYEGSTMRYYRNAVKLLERAAAFWKKEKHAFVLQLGDLVEGNHVKKIDRESTLRTVLNVFKRLDCYVCHLWGNHEFYLFSRAELGSSALNSKVKFLSNYHAKADLVTNGEKIGCHQDGTAVELVNGFDSDTIFINDVLHSYDRTAESGRKYYFSFSPHPKFKFIALDSYDISICGREEGDWEYEEAKKILAVKNTNKDWNSPFGLMEPHFVKFNGGVSPQQLQWLSEELKMAEKEEQNVIIISHIPVHPESTIFCCNIWNYQQLLDVIWKHSCVKACLCGHSHEDGDFVDHKGILHVVFPAVLECNEAENAFADVHVFEDKMRIYGHGKTKSYELKF